MRVAQVHKESPGTIWNCVTLDGVAFAQNKPCVSDIVVQGGAFNVGIDEGIITCVGVRWDGVKKAMAALLWWEM